MGATAKPVDDGDRDGGLGVAHLAQMWANADSARDRRGRPSAETPTDDDRERDRIVVDGLGLGLEPTMAQLWRSATLQDFERWVLEQKGGALDPARVRRVNALLRGESYDDATAAWLESIDDAPPALDDATLSRWSELGYVVLRDALAADERAASEQAVWQYLGVSPDDPEGWYTSLSRGIMVQLFQHPALEVARRALRIHKAFAQLWGTADLLVTTDRCGFNPPERGDWRFPGPQLHWDVELEPPVPFGTQGILYLTDTPEDQGAFSCVPGFHRRIDRWLAERPDGRDLRADDLRGDGLAAHTVAGRAGDLIIWDQRLPHGASPNRGRLPRIVQYLTMSPPFPRRDRTGAGAPAQSSPT